MLRPAQVGDLRYIDSLRKKEGKSLGFIPQDTYLSIIARAPVGGRRRWIYQRLTVAEEAGDLVGFCYSSYAREYASIVQVVIQEDARRWERASLLEMDVRQHAMRLNKRGVECRVAYDLEANLFWRAIGYTPIEQVISTWLNQRESKSKRPVWRYRLELGLADLFTMRRGA